MARDTFEGGELDVRSDVIEVRTPPVAWANAAAFLVPVSTAGRDRFVFVSARTTKGRAGFTLVDAGFTGAIGEEAALPAGTQAVLALAVPESHDQVQMVVRNASPDDDRTTVEILRISTGEIPAVKLEDSDVPAALRAPAALHQELVARGWPDLDAGDVPKWEAVRAVPVRVTHSAPLTLPPLTSAFGDEVGRVVGQSIDDLRAAVAEFDDRPVADHIATSCVQDAYLRMNSVRVVRLVEALRRRGSGNRVVEVGAWFGSFALPLARLGYEVTAVDRYDSYGRAFDTFTDLMRASGVRVVSTTREEEEHALDGLGPFDVAFAGAVIEHVPHTPRGLLDRLVAAVARSGLVAIDTPNLARYWNRHALARGESVFQAIDEQFLCSPPWEGHHREYTASELAWMLEQVGCRRVETEWFDYNLLQFDELSKEHVEALCAFLADPSQCDMILAVGEVGSG